MTAQQGPIEKWTRYNHLFRGGTVNQNGYAICIACGADENDPRITMICLQGPIAEMLKSQAAAPSSGNDKLRRLRNVLVSKPHNALYPLAERNRIRDEIDRLLADPEPAPAPDGELLAAAEWALRVIRDRHCSAKVPSPERLDEPCTVSEALERSIAKAREVGR